MLIIVVIAMVWAAELFNSAIEVLCNLLMPEKNVHIKYVKDVAAAAVLVCAIASVVVGAIIFIPKIV